MSQSAFMKMNFPGLDLRSALFYSWSASIRFELGVNESSVSIHENPLYLPNVYRRAIDLFEAIHAPDDVLYVVVDVPNYQPEPRTPQKLNIFAKYVKEQSILYQLQHETYIEKDGDDTYRIQRFSLRCRRSDIRYAALLKAICNQDMGKRPSVHYPVYFLNETKRTIYHAYDDRGCDVVGTQTETIRWVYEKFNEWILDYDRYAIDSVFA